MADFDIRYGELIDVYGHSAQSKGFKFVPARIQLNGTMFLSEHPFEMHPKMRRIRIQKYADAAFIRARVPSVFGYTPIYDEAHEKALISDGFVAVCPDGKTAIPFECHDVYGRSSLMFSADGPDEALRTQIADAFWDLIASEPNALNDFEQSVFHLGTGGWLQYGCTNGVVYCNESNEP